MSFDDVVLAVDERPRQEAWESGLRESAVAGFFDGFSFGTREGARVGAEVGFYGGAAQCVLDWTNRTAGTSDDSSSLSSSVSLPSKVRVVAAQLKSAVDDFPADDVHKTAPALAPLRAKFKLLRALLQNRLPLPPGSASASTEGF